MLAASGSFFGSGSVSRADVPVEPALRAGLNLHGVQVPPTDHSLFYYENYSEVSDGEGPAFRSRMKVSSKRRFAMTTTDALSATDRVRPPAPRISVRISVEFS